MCGKDNVKAFNRLLKEKVPDFVPVIKALYQAGMIDGLRGATIEPMPRKNKAEIKPKAVESKKVCRDCRFFIKDAQGDGLGAGFCRVIAERWETVRPMTDACEYRQEQINIDDI